MAKRSSTRHLSAIALAALTFCASCTSDVTFVQPGSLRDTTQHDSTKSDSTKTDSTTDTTTVQYASLAITVTVSGHDSTLAAVIGSPGGVLRDAIVTIMRGTSAASRDTATTDSTGVAHFTHILPSSYYSVAVVRELTPAETAQFDSADADVNAFGGGGAVSVSPPSSKGIISVADGRRGSLVISENASEDFLLPGKNQAYPFASFMDIYNNSDTTIYLDGKLVGLGPGYFADGSNAINNPTTCAETAPYQLDPNGIWSAYIWKFPGTGHDYPLLPGHVATIAQDAVDHSQIDPHLPDLSHADFEVIGGSDVDNPSVPNLTRVGPKDMLLGHGLFFGSIVIYYLADPTDLDSVPKARLPGGLSDVLVPRIPRSKILDVLSTVYTPDGMADLASQGFPACVPWVSPVFDRQGGELWNDAATTDQSIARRILTTLPDGRIILLRTKSTANDFEIIPHATPGVVP